MVSEIQALLILPPLAIGRCGSSADPMDNYEAVPNADDPAGFRKLVPAETLRVDPATGEIREVFMPAEVRFRDAEGRIRPVAPFFELWAQFAEDGLFHPLTADHLAEHGLKPADVQWRVRVGNHKAARRTGHAADKVDADTDLFGDPAPRTLTGRAPHFTPDGAIPLGTVQYLLPNAAFPEMRLRFTPAAGKIYGPTLPAGTAPDPHVAAQVYDSEHGAWGKHIDDPGDPSTTSPPAIYAFSQNPDTQKPTCRGYLDDTCDGLIEAHLTVDGQALSAYARIAVGPPDFAPDSFHVRTLADELEQILLGPEVAEPAAPEEIIDVIRRSLETIRLMNIEWFNNVQIVDQNGQVSASAFGDGANYGQTLELHARLMATLAGLNAPVDSPQYQSALRTLRGIAARMRAYQQTADFTTAGRQLMPALMRGSDDRLLALTRRQREKVGSRQ